MKLYPFSALLARMKYITRWSLMHSTRPESLSEHTCDTALLAHTLCLIARRYTGTPCRPKTVAVAALYHDAPEIITGDMPTPVKYSSPGLRDAYKALEAESVASMTRLLPPEKVHMIEERVAAVREAIGPDVDIIMENHSYLDAQSAVQLGRAVQKYNIFYFEEPNTPNPKTAKFISSKLSMPIAHGERVYSRWQYAPFFEDQSIQVIQPDLGNCGGLTEGKKICDMAYVYDISVQAHVCASPLSTAAALHLEAVIPNFVIHEHHVFNLHNYNRELCTVDLQPVNGRFKVPEEPGLGAEISPWAMEHSTKYTVE